MHPMRRLARLTCLTAVILFVAGQHPVRGNSWEPPGPSHVKGMAGLISAALKVFAAEHDGKLTAYSGDVGPIHYDELDLLESEFNSEWMNAADYTLFALDKEAGTWTVQAGPSTVPGGPTGYYRLDNGGDAESTLHGFEYASPPCGGCSAAR